MMKLKGFRVASDENHFGMGHVLTWLWFKLSHSKEKSLILHVFFLNPFVSQSNKVGYFLYVKFEQKVAVCSVLVIESGYWKQQCIFFLFLGDNEPNMQCILKQS